MEGTRKGNLLRQAILVVSPEVPMASSARHTLTESDEEVKEETVEDCAEASPAAGEPQKKKRRGTPQPPRLSRQQRDAKHAAGSEGSIRRDRD